MVNEREDLADPVIQAAQALAREGAKHVTLCCTHGVFSGNAPQKIENSVLEEVIITDTIPPREEIKRSKKIMVLSIAELLGEAIRRIAAGESISTLFT